MSDPKRLSIILITLAFSLTACSDTDRHVRGDGGGGDSGAGDGGGMDSGDRDSGGGTDGGGSDYNPFDPDASCGSTAVETERIPGSVLLVFDRSGSMDNPPGGGDSGPTKWDLATGAINSVLSTVPDELSAGLMFLPSPGGECDVDSDPQVPVAPLSTSRSAIESTLSGATPGGGVTPVIDATRKGWTHLDTLDARGQRGLIVVTDGAENCHDDERDAFLSEAQTSYEDRNYLTFVVGLTTNNNFMSTLAYNGGTPRNDECKPQCTSTTCFGDGDCDTGVSCVGNQSIGGFDIPGQCGCNDDSDCVDPQTCGSIPLLGNMCQGDANCCHYNATESDFEAEFQEALDEIARRFLDSCVFEVPKDDPATFDPSLVNVGVTFEGEDRTVLGRSDDESVDSWDYTDDSHDSIIIQGPICEELRMSSATVEIVVGCPTILI